MKKLMNAIKNRINDYRGSRGMPGAGAGRCILMFWAIIVFSFLLFVGAYLIVFNAPKLRWWFIPSLLGYWFLIMTVGDIIRYRREMHSKLLFEKQLKKQNSCTNDD
ncbi:MAG: hypothetical protein IKS90_06225 [Clostridia bacterium]|nr:hypothetical protein [Clostridia bacterium]